MCSREPNSGCTDPLDDDKPLCIIGIYSSDFSKFAGPVTGACAFLGANLILLGSYSVADMLLPAKCNYVQSK